MLDLIVVIVRSVDLTACMRIKALRLEGNELICLRMFDSFFSFILIYLFI